MAVEDDMDYASSGLTIQYALMDQRRRFPERQTRPPFLHWGGHRIVTADAMHAPREGRVRGEFIKADPEVEQGFDLKVNGWIELADGTRITTLRTWYDPLYEPVVEYPFFSNGGLLWVWNVYKMKYPGGRVVEEKWTANAGFWVEKISETDRIYHCSHGMASPPDFESLVFRITVTPLQRNR